MVTKYSIFTWISDSLNVDFLQGQFLVGCVALGTWNSWRCTCTCREKGRSVKSLQEQIELFETEMYVCGGFFSLEKSPWYSVVCFSQHFHHISGIQTKFNCLTRSRWMPVSRQFEPQQRPPVVSLSKKLYPYCLVLVGSRNGFEHHLHMQHCLFHNQTKKK